LKILKFIFCWCLSLIYASLAIIHSLFYPEKAWEFWLLFWSKSILKVLNIKLTVTGKENLKHPSIIIMNHKSILDIMTITVIAKGKVVFLAKKEILKIPLIARTMRRGGCIFIDRKNPRKAINDINQGIKNLKRNYSLITFPEGTRAKTAKLLPFKKGPIHMAINTSLPIVPIGQYGVQYIDKKGFLFSPGTLHFHIEKPLITTSWSNQELESKRILMTEAVKKAIDHAKKSYYN
jgi:1-acyl-sn-glycerol-3-phosphate acyltransferase